MTEANRKGCASMAHLHSVYDTDSHFTINPVTRAIRKDSSTKTKLMQYDHNSERFTFEIPRYVDGHDMSLCDKIEIHWINIDSKNSQNHNEDVYPVTDMQISPNGDDVVIFSWLISGKSTQLAGSLNFLIRFSCVDDDGTIEYAWNTDIFTSVNVPNGICNTETVVEMYSDTLEAWRNELFGIAGTVEAQIQAIENAGSTAVSSVQSAESTGKSNIQSSATEAVKSIQDAEAEALENIGTGVDETFTQSGKAADAAATGKAIDELNEDLADISRDLSCSQVLNKMTSEDFSVTEGYIRIDGTINTGTTDFAYTSPIHVIENEIVRVTATGYVGGNNSLSIISVLENGKYTCIKESTNISNDYEWVADRNCDIVFSFLTSNKFEVNSIVNVKQSIEDICEIAESANQTVKNKSDKIEKLVEVGIKTDGKYKQTNGNEYSVNIGNYVSVDVEYGEQYLICGTNVNESFPLCMIIDSNGSIIHKIEGNKSTGYTDVEVTIPYDGVKLYINGNSNNTVAFAFKKVYDNPSCDIDRHIKWEHTGEDFKGIFVQIRSGKAVPTENSHSGGYDYALVDYDYNNPVRLRFTGDCNSSSFPILIFADEYNNCIGKLYDTVGDAIDREEVEIPKGTKKIYCQSCYIQADKTNLIEVATPTSVKTIGKQRVGIILGDSIVQGVGVLPSYNERLHDFIPRNNLSWFIEQYSDLKIYNGGLGGGCTGERTIDFQKVADCINSGDFSDIQSGITQYSLNKFASANWDRIAELDFNDVDFIGIGYGYNDWNFGRTEEQIKTGFRYGLDKILAKYPNLKIYLFTPSYYKSDDGTKDSDVYANTSSGLYLYQIAEFIEDISKEYHLPCKNLYYSGNINSFNASLYMNGSPHRNEKGYELLGRQWAKFIETN